MDIREIQEQCLKDGDEWFPSLSRDPIYLMLCLQGEVGELANEFKKMMRDDFEDEDRHAKMKEEAVDVFIYLMQLSAVMGMNIEKEYNVKRQRNAGRFGTGR